MTRCKWCSDPINDPHGTRRYCSTHCKAQDEGQRRGWGDSPMSWDGDVRFAVQPPMAFMWRQVCLLCGRERWLRLPMTDAQQLRQSHCPQCQGFRLLELDQGIQRPHDVEWVAA